MENPNKNCSRSSGIKYNFIKVRLPNLIPRVKRVENIWFGQCFFTVVKFYKNILQFSKKLSIRIGLIVVDENSVPKHCFVVESLDRTFQFNDSIKCRSNSVSPIVRPSCARLTF